MTFFKKYSASISEILSNFDWSPVEELCQWFLDIQKSGRKIYICGNGGSSANAIHLVNDLIYGISPGTGKGIRAEALTANQSVITCLGNDIGYENIFSYQIDVKGEENDLLLCFSGSGNSANLVKAVDSAQKKGMKTAAILGFSGGKLKDLVDLPIHFAIDDMQISEDLQQITGHMISRQLLKELNN